MPSSIESPNPPPHRVRPEIRGAGRQAAPEFPDRAAVVEPPFIERAAPAFPELERLIPLDSLPQDPLPDESRVLPIADPAFGEGCAAGWQWVQRGHKFR